jgi:hypothetical protein
MAQRTFAGGKKLEKGCRGVGVLHSQPVRTAANFETTYIGYCFTPFPFTRVGPANHDASRSIPRQ